MPEKQNMPDNQKNTAPSGVKRKYPDSDKDLSTNQSQADNEFDEDFLELLNVYKRKKSIADSQQETSTSITSTDYNNYSNPHVFFGQEIQSTNPTTTITSTISKADLFVKNSPNLINEDEEQAKKAPNFILLDDLVFGKVKLRGSYYYLSSTMIGISQPNPPKNNSLAQRYRKLAGIHNNDMIREHQGAIRIALKTLLEIKDNPQVNYIELNDEIASLFLMPTDIIIRVGVTHYYFTYDRNNNKYRSDMLYNTYGINSSYEKLTGIFNAFKRGRKQSDTLIDANILTDPNNVMLAQSLFKLEFRIIEDINKYIKPATVPVQTTHLEDNINLPVIAQNIEQPSATPLENSQRASENQINDYSQLLFAENEETIVPEKTNAEELKALLLSDTNDLDYLFSKLTKYCK